jgi:hypothetical protein
MRQRIPRGYEIDAEYEKQIQSYILKRKMYDYRWCGNYSVIPYGKPYKILIKPSLPAMEANSSLLLVFTTPRDDWERKYFRKYYIWKGKYPLNYIFVMASDKDQNVMNSVFKEAKEHGDILQFNTTNSYHLLILNELLTYHYITNLHLPIRYVIKTDSDMVLNIPMIMRNIYSRDKMKKKIYYGGDCLTANYRYGMRKHYIPPCIYQNENVARFARGGLYFFTYNILPSILISFRHADFIIHNEDGMFGKMALQNNISCMPQYHWLARHGCVDNSSCLTYASVHPQNDTNEIKRYYRYFSTESNLKN